MNPTGWITTGVNLLTGLLLALSYSMVIWGLIKISGYSAPYHIVALGVAISMTVEFSGRWLREANG